MTENFYNGEMRSDCGNYMQKLVIKAFYPSSENMNSALAEADRIKNLYVSIKISAEYFDTKIEIFYAEGQQNAAETIFKIFIEFLGFSVYSMEDVSLPELVNHLLALRKKTISVAESFTSGRVSSAIVSVPGASAHFQEGIVSYSNLSKKHRLGVTDETLYNYGAVSAECAAEMVRGLLDTDECDVALSTTGIAGPKSDNTNKPVGLCYFGVGVKGSIKTYEMFLEGNRNFITETGVRACLFYAVKTLKYM
ncbi:MAG: CinA family protein [Christensenellaceae bacterium]|nr:CinA family protein [Christensenellaceae bacterium]